MAHEGIVPHLVVHDGKAAVAFYQAALGAEVCHEVPADDGKRLMHAALRVGGAMLMLCDEFPEYCGGVRRAPKHVGVSGVTLHLTVPDCDAAVAKMAAAGGTVAMPPMDAFWGDRYAKVTDPFGHEWSFSHPLPAERAQAAVKAWEERCAAGATKA
jgi:PhnB protein